MKEGVVPVEVGQHPGLTVVAQTGLVLFAFSLHRGIANTDLEGAALANVHHPAVGAGRHQQGAQRVGPKVEPCRVVGLGLAGFLMGECQSTEVIR